MGEVVLEGKTPAIQPPVAAAEASETGTMSGPLVSAPAYLISRKVRPATIDGVHLPVYAHWSYSDSFEYLVGVSGAVVAHSLLQLLISASRLRRKALVIPSQRYAWVIYAGDQIFAYALMSAGSAASGVTSLNRTGIRHTALPNFCKPLHAFCNRVAASIALTFLSCFLLAASAVLDVIWLTCY
ncbi:CASP-like protein 3A1 isoform X2 [Beta vulgaris subsp. vulgaris]|uniref:CASP-like protein 3A1 isoform X2 n=1 Tax=Beta vulgaris subsp. vulgaris TaxID=3555 RepID=UPI00053F8848|nr:CASP-like protein 3A1 isoform X2 [Beta vulgaris subsp. vulgaris]